MVKRKKIFAEFEVLMGQLFHHSSKSKECLSALKAKLNHLAHAFCGTQIDLTDFTMHRECFDAIKSLRSNDKIIISKPDKDSGVVILNKSDYITKMNLILNDASKFQQIGPADTNDNTAKIEAKIQRRLLQLSNGGVMHESVYKEIRPTGSLRPRLYSLPKVHKKDVPLRPILSMVGSSQHALAKLLAAVIDPVLQLYSNNCIKDSFTFAKEMQDLQMLQKETFLCLFDIRSLQRWSRGHKARGEGQGHKKSPRPRPRTAFPRTEPLKAKDRNARGQGQGPRTQAQAFSKKKGFQKFFSCDLQFIGVPRIFDWGGLNYKSHEMTSSKFFQRGSFCGTKIS